MIPPLARERVSFLTEAYLPKRSTSLLPSLHFRAVPPTSMTSTFTTTLLANSKKIALTQSGMLVLQAAGGGTGQSRLTDNNVNGNPRHQFSEPSLSLKSIHEDLLL